MLKVGDKVALVGSPNKLFGTVTRVDKATNWADIEYTDADGRKWFSSRRASDGHVLSGTWKSQQVVPYVDPSPALPPVPKYLAVSTTGAVMARGDELVGIGSRDACLSKTGSHVDGVALLNGDAIYKLVGRIETHTLNEEDIPITEGYRWSVSDFKGGHNVEVVAVRGDYAFIQSYNSEGVAQGCTTVRVSSIPKTKRPCHKIVKQLTKE